MTIKSVIWIVACAALLTGCPAWPDPIGDTTSAPAIPTTDMPTTDIPTAASPTAGSPAPASPAPTSPAADILTTADPALASPAPSAASPMPLARWVPAPGTSWQWQLTSPVDTSVDAQVYDIDGFEATPDVVRELHAQGRKVICYINAGAAEDFRPDYNVFPPQILGKSDGWDGEKWLDIRRLDVLLPIMATRFDMCQRKGFDAVEADLADGYANDTGFPLTAQDQLSYNRALAGLAHERGMSIGLKNDLDQIPALLNDFDFAVNEQCAQYHECGKLTPFIQAGKAVFHVEYELETTQFCPETTALGFSSLRKNTSLDAARWPC
ncbi:MAG TPA: endo alpha-1,4 polygalactosaminidase [Pseudonocardiaceae bacterium]|nr:endo alpha-1,4 polygalactosaminidase [Pseudonocardiaceae bacterium]